MTGPLKSYEIENYPKVSRPGQRISIDCLGAFPETLTGNDHIVLIVDYFTKFVVASALPDI